MIEKRYFIRLSYLGTNYSGWQIQPNAISVQEVLQNNLSKLNGNKPVSVMGCGRTDAGVHAKNFIAHFDFSPITDLDHFIYKLNHMLPHDIAIHGVCEMADKAHARYDATQRTYQYLFHFSKNPFYNTQSVLIASEINFSLMDEGAKILLEYEDFEAFSRVNTNVNNFLCQVNLAQFEKIDDQLIFTISANRFLRNMVRAIVGTLLDLGNEKINLDDFRAIIDSKTRSEAGKSAPAKGLVLEKIEYPYQVP